MLRPCKSAYIDNLAFLCHGSFELTYQASLAARFWHRDPSQRFTPFRTSTNLIFLTVVCTWFHRSRRRCAHFFSSHDSYTAIMRSLGPSFPGNTEDQEIVIGPPDETAPIFMIFEVPPVMAVTPSIVFPCCTFNGRNGNLSLSTKFLGHPCSQPLTDLGERWLDTRHHSFPLVPRRLGRTPGPDSESWLYQICMFLKFADLL